MVSDIKVEFAAKLTAKLGTGPLKTVVYSGTYGRNTSYISSWINKEDEKDKIKEILVKEIELKITKTDIEWEVLQMLQHPNVARYILVEKKMKIFQPNALYIIQEYCKETLSTFLEKTWPTYFGSVLKTATRQMVSGLTYLHDSGIVHGNLKTSNVLVQPPLYKPKGFVLTDYAYTDYRSYPEEKNWEIWPCFRAKRIPDLDEITKWMAPELLAETPFLISYRTKTAGDEATQIKKIQPSTATDVFSLGMIIFSMFKKVTGLDKVDEILCKLLVMQMTIPYPSRRISCQDICKHPFLIIQPESGGFAEARMDYIKELYDRIREGSSMQQIEENASLVTKKFLPWDEPIHSFGGRMYFEMNQRPEIERKYDGNSFMDLLRLIRNTKEHPIEEKMLKRIKEEISNDAFSHNFPFALPLIYVCVEQEEISIQLIYFLSEIYNQVCKFSKIKKGEDEKR